MKWFLKYLAPILLIAWLARVHPLRAIVAVVLCFNRGGDWQSRAGSRYWKEIKLTEIVGQGPQP